MTLRKWLTRILVFALVVCVSGWGIRAQEPRSTVVFREAAFPTVDTSPVPEDGFDTLFPGAQFASAYELGKSLSATTTGLLVLPYGSAFPEECWPDIEAFLNRGGNLLVLGGK